MTYPFPWGPPPPGYVPGLGRGATGFVTAIENGIIDFEADAPITSTKKLQRIRDEEDRADAFYREIESKLKSRTHSKPIPKPPDRTVFEEVRGKFADLRDGLRSISANEWANLPEIGATTAHRPKWELYTYASDRTITNDFDESELSQAVKRDEELDILSVSRAQRTVLSVQLSKFVPAESAVDVSQFLAELDAQAATVLQQFNDLELAADLYRRMTHANRGNAQGWLLRGRLEEKRGRVEKARAIARDGMIYCPESELLVLEAARLSPRQEAIAIIESALKVNHTKSEKLWLHLFAYQTDVHSKRATIEAAVRAMPRSELLWLAAVASETGDRHTETLKRALEFLPESTALWLEGCKAGSFEDCMWFVQNGLKAIQNEADICVAWAQACERFGEDMSEPCERAVAADPGKDWISVAQQTEKEGFPQTARRLLLLVPVGEDWIPGAVTCENRQFVQTAAILFERFAKETGRFRELLEFAKRRGKLSEKVAELVDANPTHEGLISEICEVVDPATAISILEKGTGRIPTSVTIAKVLIDSYLGTKQLHKARDFAASVMPVVEQEPALSLTLARINEQFGGDSGYLEGCIRRFPSVPEFWLMLAGSSSEALPVLKTR